MIHWDVFKESLKKHIYLITGHIMIIYITMMVQLIKYPYPIVIKMMNQS